MTTNHFTPWVSWHAELPFFFAMLFAAWVAVVRLVRHGRTARVMVPAPALPLLFLLGVTLLQLLSGKLIFLGEALTTSIYLILSIICLAIGFGLTTSDCGDVVEQRERLSPIAALSLALLAGGIASTIVALVQVLEVWETSSWILRMPNVRRPGGNLGQPNHLATLLLMAIASLVYLHSSRRLGNGVMSLVLALLCIGLAITESRTGALGLLALLVWWWWKQPFITPQVSRFWAIGIAAMYLAMFKGWPTLLTTIQVLPSGTLRARLDASGGEARMDVWPQLVDAIMQKPWMGWGVRQTAEAHNSVAHTYNFSLPFSYSHNLVIDLGLWIGLPVTGVLFVMTFIWLWRRVRVTKTLTPWYGMAIALPLGVHSMFEFPFAYAYFLVPAMLGLGAMEGALQRPPTVSLRTLPAVGVLLVTSMLTLWSVVEYIQLEEDFRVARFELLRIGETNVDVEQPRNMMLTQLEALTDATRVVIKPGLSAEQQDLLKRVALHYPWSSTQYRYAMSLALNDHPAEAARQLQVIRAQHGDRIYRKLRLQIEDRLIEVNASGANLSLP
ncbi:PglL family O-oligosaccharyltransferase [Hydrogenophaga sp. PBL-H3]|uniref:PglL family O-oligosaccharyltransferase n=1 Tax=Hydrogenophaga sp. PBL-H3 TaxID=434010 RepID=UPI001358C5D8|nr:Wzy polymerase domain-containing protein [Hydrogenophaga sp. PBL-H3]